MSGKEPYLLYGSSVSPQRDLLFQLSFYFCIHIFAVTILFLLLFPAVSCLLHCFQAIGQLWLFLNLLNNLHLSFLRL